jgi:hypothetical protein
MDGLCCMILFVQALVLAGVLGGGGNGSWVVLSMALAFWGLLA